MIGAFRHLAVVQEEVLTPDAAGGFTAAWHDLAAAPQLHFAITAIARSAVQRHGRSADVSAYKLRGRYRADLAAGMRLCWRGKVLKITGLADPDGQMRWIDIAAEEA
jgi:head-tail adaptor